MHSFTLTCESTGDGNEWSDRKYCVEMCLNPAKDSSSAQLMGVKTDPNADYFIDYNFTCLDGYYETSSMVRYLFIIIIDLKINSMT